MSKGSKIVPVRISDDLYQAMESAIDSRNKATQEEPFNVSDFIRYCIRYKLAHTERGRSSARKKSKAAKQGQQRVAS